MKFFAALAFLLASFCLASAAVPVVEMGTNGEVKSETEKVPLDIVELKSGYVFESDLGRDGRFGKQYAIQNEFEYGHRFKLKQNIYLRLGFSYDRFDFGETDAPIFFPGGADTSPIPEHLQRAAGVIGVEYMKGADTGAFIYLRPGFYTEDDFDSDSLDCPITAGTFFVLKPDKLYVLVGANAAFLRGDLPVIPFAGLVWIPNDNFRLMAIVPEPRLIYSPTDKLDLYVGGEFVGGSFRTDRDDNIFPSKLSGAQVDYYDYRGSVGFTYGLTRAITFDLGGGYSIQRSFNFNRADENFRTDPAPYLRVSLKAKF